MVVMDGVAPTMLPALAISGVVDVKLTVLVVLWIAVRRQWT